MDIRWTTEAASNLEQISLHIAEDNAEAAIQVVRTIFQRIEQLVVFPNRGRIGREDGTRELVLSPLPYLAAYRVRESTIESFRSGTALNAGISTSGAHRFPSPRRHGRVDCAPGPLLAN